MYYLGLGGGEGSDSQGSSSHPQSSRYCYIEHVLSGSAVLSLPGIVIEHVLSGIVILRLTGIVIKAYTIRGWGEEKGQIPKLSHPPSSRQG